MKATLKLEDGRELVVEVNEETIANFSKIKRTGYERVDLDEEYFSEEDGKVYCFSEDYQYNSERSYESANYYSDETIAENNARADMLMRKLRRFSVEHREKTLNWNDEDQNKYYIYYDYNAGKLVVNDCYYMRRFGTIFFDSDETARAAIKNFESELIWFFTEYKDCF